MNRRLKLISILIAMFLIPSMILLPVVLRAKHQVASLEEICKLNGECKSIEMLISYDEVIGNEFYGYKEINRSIWFNMWHTAFSVEFRPDPTSIELTVECVNSIGGDISLTLRNFETSKQVLEHLKNLQVAELRLCETRLSDSDLDTLKASLAPTRVSISERCSSYSDMPRHLELEWNEIKGDKERD